jgi:undecaprenyl-diphosphatase
LTRRRTLWVVLVGGLAGFAVLAAGYDRMPLSAVDGDVADWIASSMPRWLEWPARSTSALRGWIGTALITVPLVVFLLATRRVLDAAWVAVTIVGIEVLTSLLKEALDRPRPDAGSAITLPFSDSFPSGHASGAVVVFGVLATLGAERWPERGRLLWWAAALVSFAIGVSRVVLNVHYVSDVLAGWCLGIAWLSACLLVRKRLRRSAPEV